MGVRLLQDKLVQKYFGCNSEHPHKPGPCDFDCETVMAYNVLAAMDAQVQRGDRILIWRYDKFEEDRWDNKPIDYSPHFSALRLPDAFQTKREKCWCRCHNIEVLPKNELCNCGGFMTFHKSECSAFRMSPTIERKIEDICHNWQSDATPPGLVVELEKLVELVRSEK